MIEWVDIALKNWAAEVRGGLPGRSRVEIEAAWEIGNETTNGELSDDAWRIECIVRKLCEPLQKIVMIHYLPSHGVIRDRIQAASRFLGDGDAPDRQLKRGTDAYRRAMEAIISRQQARYYRLLHDAHEVIDCQFKLAAAEFLK